MLTSSHYLLGGFLASSCALGVVLQSSMPANFERLQNTAEPSIGETIDVSYRGSGRVEGDPETNDLKNAAQGIHLEASDSDLDSLDVIDVNIAGSEGTSSSQASGGKDLVSHRGSGRVRPFSM